MVMKNLVTLTGVLLSVNKLSSALNLSQDKTPISAWHNRKFDVPIMDSFLRRMFITVSFPKGHFIEKDSAF